MLCVIACSNPVDQPDVGGAAAGITQKLRYAIANVMGRALKLQKNAGYCLMGVRI